MNRNGIAKRDRLVSILGMVASVLVMCFLCSSAVDWVLGEDEVQPGVAALEPVIADSEPGQ